MRPAAWLGFTVALGAAVLVPIAIFFAPAFGSGALNRLVHVDNIGKILTTTVLLAVGGTAVGATLAVGLSVLVGKTAPRWRGIVGVIPLMPLVIPPIAFVYGWIFLLDTRVGYANILLRKIPLFGGGHGPINIYSIGGILFVTSIEQSAVVFAFLDSRRKEIDGSMVAAARLAGASSSRTFWTITFPLLRPALVAGMVVGFLLQLGQFTAPLFLGAQKNIQVITTEIFRVREQFPIDYGLTAALGLPLVVFGVLAIIVQRRAIGDQRKYVTTGSSRGLEFSSSRSATVMLLTYGVVFIGLPIAACVLVALSPFWNGRLDEIHLTLSNVSSAFSDPAVTGAIMNSLKASVIASVIVVALGFIGSLAMSGVAPAPRVVVRLLDVIFIAPLAVPRALLGVVVLFVFIRPPFFLYGTLTIYVIGYVFIALPFSVRSQYASLIGVHSSLFEASRICGAGQWRTIMKIALPTAYRGMVAAFTISFVFLANDVAVSLMIQAPGHDVVGTALYTFQQQGSVPPIAVLAIVMTVITAAVITLTVVISGRRALENL